MAHYPPFSHDWRGESNGGASPVSAAYALKNATVSFGEGSLGQEDQSSRCNTPSMTRGSSRSTSSSVVACDHCSYSAEHCLCHSVSDSESVRYQQSEIESGASSNTTPEIAQVGFHMPKQKDRPRFPVPHAREGLLYPATRNIRPLATAGQMRVNSPLKNSEPIDQVLEQEDHCLEAAEPLSNPLPGIQTSTPYETDLKIATDAIEYPNSDSDNSDSEMEDDEDNDEDDNWSGQDYNLEARILQALDYNLPLAAHLIPLLHNAIYAEFATNITQKVGPWRQGVTKSCPAAGGSGSQKSPSSAAPTNNSNSDPRKRQRNFGSAPDERGVDEEADEDEDEDDNRDPKRLKDEPDSPGQSPHPLLACPFHKRDPKKYSIQHEMVGNARKSVYRTCAGPGFKSIQRLMEHLRRKHNPVQCDRCCRIFDGPDRAACMLDLKQHHQLPESCELNPSGVQEGISDSQWATLEKKRSKKIIPGLSSVEKWNEIWTVLFPGVIHPQTPWYDQYMSDLPPRSPSEECSHFLEIYWTILHHKIEQEDIRLETGMQERIINAAKHAFNVWTNTRRSSEANSSSNSSSARIHSLPSLLSGPYQVVSMPNNSTRYRLSTATGSSAVQSDAYSRAFSHGSTESPGMVKPRRSAQENPGIALTSSYMPMQQPSYSEYNSNAMVTPVFPEPSAQERYSVTGLSSHYPINMALDVNLGDGGNPCPISYEGGPAFGNFNPAATLGGPNFPSSATGIAPAQTMIQPLDGHTQNLGVGSSQNWMHYPSDSQRYGGGQ